MKKLQFVNSMKQDMPEQSPSEKASTLIDMVNMVHDCANIMQHRSLAF